MPDKLQNPLRLAIIGCGLIGKKRAAALATLPDARLAAVCDLDAVRARDLAALHPGTEALTDAATLFARADLDAVIIATLNGALAPLSLAAVRAGKHVLVEKPGALHAAQLREVQAAATLNGAKVRLGYNHRFHPALQKAREIIDSGRMGPLMFLRGRYGHGGRPGYDREWRADPRLSGGGELIDQGVHLIDLAGWFLGDFTRIDGHATTNFWDMKVDDNAFVSLRTAADQTAWLHASCTEWKNLFSLEIYGRTGKILINGLGGSYGEESLTYYPMPPDKLGQPPVAETFTWPGKNDGSWALETAAFLADIRLDREPAPGLREGIRTLEIVETIYRNSGYPRS
jgi:predicted dehydrogenase